MYNTQKGDSWEKYCNRQLTGLCSRIGSRAAILKKYVKMSKRWSDQQTACEAEVRWSKYTTIELITKWLRDSSLKVNEAKTEICVYYKMDNPLIDIIINNVMIRTEYAMNVPGVLFDSKLQWTATVAQLINKAKKSLHTLI